MTLVAFANIFLASLTSIAQFGIVVTAVTLIVSRKTTAFARFLAKYGIFFAFLAALMAMLGSLFYSQIAGFTPCELCWFQRICMYPLVVLLGVALIKKSDVIIDYALTLAGIGWIISLYHNYIYYFQSNSTMCTVLSGVSCVKHYVMAFGYITIPMMSFTAFTLVITFLLFKRSYAK